MKLKPMPSSAREANPPLDLECSRFDLDGGEYVVLSFPARRVDTTQLSPAETEIARAILEGKTNQEIAHVRQRSVRTIANQVASIFRKMDVGSRLELAVRLQAIR